MNLQKITLTLGLTLLAGVFTGCKDMDRPDPNRHVTQVQSQPKTAFDNWLKSHYTDSYNVQYIYTLDDIEADRSRNLAPAKLENSMKLAKIILHAWYGAYDEATGRVDFMRKTSPRQLLIVGSASWNGDGTITQGTAEGGLKVTLYQANWLNVNDPQALNTTFFKVMHHEFSHILHQNKIWPTTEYDGISEGYAPTSWSNRRQLKDYAPLGFITAYASSQPREDIAEMTACYITFPKSQWDAVMEAAGEEGRAKLNKKMEIIKTYMKGTWGIDMDQLRTIAQRRLEEAAHLNLLEDSWKDLLGSSLRAFPQTARATEPSPAAYAEAYKAVVEELRRHPKFLEVRAGKCTTEDDLKHVVNLDQCAAITQYFH